MFSTRRKQTQIAKGKGEHGSVRKCSWFIWLKQIKMAREAKVRMKRRWSQNEKCFPPIKEVGFILRIKNAAKDYSGCTFGMDCKGKCGGSRLVL